MDSGGGHDGEPRALLIEAPFEPLERGRLAPALLKAELQLRGMACDVEHLGHAFAELLGRDEYRRLVREIPPGALACDWVFAEAAFGAAVPAAERYVAEVLTSRWRCSAEQVDVVLRARALVPAFLRGSLAEIDWPRYAVLGFSAPAGQSVAAIAVAGAVKQAHPGLRVVFGGPAWHGVMGRRQLTALHCVDAACTGDGDEAFPAYCLWVASGCRGPIPPGLLLRRRGGACTGGAGAPVTDLDALPPPDYADFYRGLARWGVTTTGVHLAAEASRGCWWAARRPCAFCGLNGPARRYRPKSADRVLRELRGLDARWRPWLIDLVDNVVPPSFLRVALPRLAATPLTARLFFEARPVLTRGELRSAARAGAHLQLGIESLSQHVLDLVGKGTDATANLRQLRWCREEGVPVTWNLLHDVPGETARDYRESRALLPALRHLSPPEGRGPVEVQRFSRYFGRPAQFGLVNVRPTAAYRYIYPFGPAVLRDVAYLFDADHAPSARAGAALERERAAFLRELDEWTAERSRSEQGGGDPGEQAGRLALG